MDRRASTRVRQHAGWLVVAVWRPKVPWLEAAHPDLNGLAETRSNKPFWMIAKRIITPGTGKGPDWLPAAGGRSSLIGTPGEASWTS